ncbi:hypothetical protein GE253_19465 [Niveispirillum sp. SYP-B3756]|uniref:hypothetical protein n=1 Tax=Niveispirillum sp. SYP-B3756 TaxID=2662178 RepID=UPI00129124F6|nr:hypothetical protein [Niveispirillum sp. SYP-B3756]MQP67509.1 hypothetical protein [Niveispirillum sp. SYP-B3756]
MPILSSPKNYREQILLAKAEASYGVDAGPTGANALRCYDVQIKPLQADKKTRSYIQPHLGARPSLMAMQRSEISFKVEACGAGVAGELPPHHDLLRACALNSTQVAATPTSTIASIATYGAGGGGTVTYTRTAAYAGVLARTVTATCTTAGASGAATFTIAAPAVGHLPAYNVTNVTLTDGTALALPGGASITPTVGTAFTVGNTFSIALTPAETRYERTSDRATHGSVSLYMMIDDERHKIVGARGTVKLVLGIGEFPYFEFSMTGYFAPPELAVAPIGDFSDWTDPLHIAADSSSLWLANKELVANNAELDLANTYALKERIGRRAVRINEWATKFTSTVEAPALADLDLWNVSQSRTRITAQVLHGKVPGNALFIDLASMQIDAPSPSEDESDYMLGITGDVLPVQGDDELKLCFR